MIVSFIEGRIRLRHPILRDENVLQQIISVIQNQAGINQIQKNVRTGSILIEYDPAVISKEELLAARQMFEAFLPKQDNLDDLESVTDEKEALVVQRLEQMLAQIQPALKKESGILVFMLLVSVASGYLGLKKWHTLLASGFAVFAARHFNNKRTRTDNLPDSILKQ